MDVVYAQQPFPETVTRTLFLAGPTPRSAGVPSWRPEALRLLAERGFDGAVFVPETADGQWRESYDDQIDWELSGLRRADLILFWIPRQLDTMPAFTTNVELGMWASSGKVVLAAPEDAPKMRYLRAIAERRGIPQADTLGGAIDLALALLGPGARREGGEVMVPLHVFQTPSFQQWLSAQRGAGNALLGANVEWTFRVGPDRRLFYWALHVDVWVASEGRRKKNEVVLARPDLAAVVLYRRDAADPGRSVIALVREFRSPGATSDGHVRENPGGTSLVPRLDMMEVAIEEVHEEVGLRLDAARLRPLGVRQLAATMSSHRAHVFAAELDEEEVARLRAEAGVVHGADAGERTTVEVWSWSELLRRDGAVDWSTLGMIAQALS